MTLLHNHYGWLFVLMLVLPMLAQVMFGCSLAARRGSQDRTAARDRDVRDLPLVIYPPQGPEQDCLAVLLSGDGGWAKLSRVVAGDLARAGVGVIGFNSRKYFWQPRTPADAACDLERAIEHYRAAWHKDGVILIGYSRGAGVLPYLYNRLTPSARERVRLLALLGLTPGISFELRLRDYLGHHFEVDEMPVLPELARIEGRKILCVYGDAEPESICRRLDKPHINIAGLPGGHHFGGRYDDIAALILKDAGVVVGAGASDAKWGAALPEALDERR